MSEVHQASGWRADWINAWLAAIGVTVLLDDARVSWSDDVLPMAEFHVPNGPFIDRLWRAFPDEDSLARLAIAHEMDGQPEFPRNVTLSSFAARSSIARMRHDFSLGSTVTDLAADLDEANLPHGAFDPPMPRGITIWDRLVSCVRAARAQGPDGLQASLAGSGTRIEGNGLGFDPRRLASGVQVDAKVMVDPFVESFAFYGLALFPVTGRGRAAQQRLWLDRPTQRGALVWASWKTPLDRWAIDAFLDQLGSYSSRRTATEARSWYRTVPYEPTGTSDTTRAYFSERFDPFARA